MTDYKSNRIKELAPQCWELTEFGLNFNYQKFAELIVRECIEIVDKWSYDGPYREEGDIIPVKKIKEHFGVEE